jgi:predicted CXXCH cytochrome family protein
MISDTIKRVIARIMRVQGFKRSRVHVTGKQDFEHSNIRMLEVLFILIALLIFVSPAHSENTFNLKKGPVAKVCVECHDTIQEALEKPVVHFPVEEGECTGCHNPHTSNHGKLLVDDVNSLCQKCHEDIIPEEARSVHKAVIEGNCVSCHKPHASENEALLVKKGNELCYECHQDVADYVKKVEFKHNPVEKKKGCLNCHNPHASAKFNFMLKNDAPSLCAGCHKTNTKSFASRHMGYPVGNSHCTSCHNAHGSNKRKIIFNNVHEPVARKECEKCHEDPTSQTPLKVKKVGMELCKDCHKDMINKVFKKRYVHWPIVDNIGCLNCHSPHGYKQKKLLAGKIIDVCGKCHSDKVRLQKISINNPENESICKPVKEGNCIACHSGPHSSDNVLFTAEKSMSFGSCAKCHDWKAHSMHPIGEKVIDPRNKNLIVKCLSCHKAGGTGNKRKELHYDSVYTLCIQCHESYKR